MSRIVATQLIGSGYAQFVDDQIVSLGRTPIMLIAWWGITGRSMVWKTSDKGIQVKLSPTLLIAPVVIVTANIMAVIYALTQLQQMKSGYFVQLYIYSFSLVWVLFNIWKVGQWILKTIQAARRPHGEYQFEAPVPLLDETGQLLGHFNRLSTTNGEAILNEKAALSPETSIQLLLPGHCVRVRLTDIKKSGKHHHLSFQCEDQESHWRLRLSLYSIDWHRQIRLAPFSAQTRKRDLGGFWQAARFSRGDSPAQWAVFQAPDETSAPRHLMVTCQLSVGDEIALGYLRCGQVQEDRYRIQEEIKVTPKLSRDLNNQNYSLYKLDDSNAFLRVKLGI
jgi:hypothetical protein